VSGSLTAWHAGCYAAGRVGKEATRGATGGVRHARSPRQVGQIRRKARLEAQGIMRLFLSVAVAGIVVLAAGVGVGSVRAQTPVGSGTMAQTPVVSGTVVPGGPGTLVPGGATPVVPVTPGRSVTGTGNALTPLPGTVTPVGASTTLQTPLTATMDGSAEVPGPGQDNVVGSAAVTIDRVSNTVCYAMHVVGLTSAVTMAHIHEGAVGIAGPVVVTLSPPTGGDSSGCVAGVDSGVVSRLAQNPAGFYVNVHTTDLPDGAARGQLGR
jgi:hypothetical protein